MVNIEERRYAHMSDLIKKALTVRSARNLATLQAAGAADVQVSYAYWAS